MDEAKCPNCGAILTKRPQRKTKCKACGQYIYVRYTPSDRTKRLMTESQAQAAEQAWAAYNERNQVAQVASSLGISGTETSNEIKPKLIALAKNVKVDKHRRKLAAMQLMKLSKAREELESWCALAYAMDLEKLAENMVPMVMIRGESGRCSACARLDGTKINIQEAMQKMPLPPPDCPNLHTHHLCLTWYRAIIPGWGGN